MTQQVEEMNEMLITLTADIVSAHVSNNSVAVSDLPVLIGNVHSALANLSGGVVQSEPQEPAVGQQAFADRRERRFGADRVSDARPPGGAK